MTQRVVEISTPSRLHFGFLSFGRPRQRQFGGVGVMLDAPRLNMRLEPSAKFRVAGPLSERVCTFAKRWAESHDMRSMPKISIRVLTAPDEHVGLGVGTQLGLSLSAGLNLWMGFPEDSLDVMARRVSRGLRSSVGTYGFRYGGLIAENGKLADEALGQLVAHVVLPAEWRFVLFRPVEATGLAGRSEQQAFDRLPPVHDGVRDALWRELVEQLLPSAQRRDFDGFSNSLYCYGRQAGMCFSAYQGGPFASPLLASWVQRARRLGITGVGQSSWGPTLFGVVPSDEAAIEFAEKLRASANGTELNIVVSAPSPSGAKVQWSPSAVPRPSAEPRIVSRSAYKPAS